MNINKYIDFTLLRSDATQDDFRILCTKAILNNYFSVCVPLSWINYVKQQLQNSNVKVCTVVGFPLGNTLTEIKVQEVYYAIKYGVDEIDMVMNIGRAKSGHWEYVEMDIQKIRNIIPKKVLKIILETSLLTEEEIVKCCEICKKCKVNYIKTSTGFTKEGATEKNIKLIHKTIGDAIIRIKASGGIRTREDAIKMITAGATRIGTSHEI